MADLQTNPEVSEVEESIPVESVIAEENATGKAKSEEKNASALTEEEQENLDLLIKKTGYHAGRKGVGGTGIKEASKKEKKEMFRSEHVVQDDDSTELTTEALELKQELKELEASYASGRVLKGIVTSIIKANPDRPASVNLAEILYGNGHCTIYIPDFLMFEYDVKQTRDPDRQKRIANHLEHMIGAEIGFVVKDIDKKQLLVHADRLKALDKKVFENYIRETSDGKPRITEGQIVQGTVTAVFKNNIVVDALGAEAIVKRFDKSLPNPMDGNEVSWSFIGDCREHFTVGQKVNVKVLSLEHKQVTKFNEKEVYNLMNVKLSIKQCTRNPMDKFFDRVQVGGRYAAEVTYNAGKSVFVRLYGQIDCICANPSYGALPENGQTRIIEITEKVVLPNGTKRLFGIFSNIG